VVTAPPDRPAGLLAVPHAFKTTVPPGDGKQTNDSPNGATSRLNNQEGSDAHWQARDPFQVPTELADGLGVESLPRTGDVDRLHNLPVHSDRHPICPCRNASSRAAIPLC